MSRARGSSSSLRMAQRPREGLYRVASGTLTAGGDKYGNGAAAALQTAALQQPLQMTGTHVHASLSPCGRMPTELFRLPCHNATRRVRTWTLRGCCLSLHPAQPRRLCGRMEFIFAQMRIGFQAEQRVRDADKAWAGNRRWTTDERVQRAPLRAPRASAETHRGPSTPAVHVHSPCNVGITG